MKSCGLKILPFLFFFLLFRLTMLAQSQQVSLKVGDKAPALSAFKWIKGGGISDFEKGRIYVLEFGATWCGPCAAAIPTLSSLSDRYANGVSIISLFVMENAGQAVRDGNTAYVDKVVRYVKGKGDKIRYSVAVDSPDKSLEHTWLTAAGKVGIPQIFIIDKDGFVAWIGSNPSAIEKIIDKINNPGYKIPDMTPLSSGAETLYDHSKLLLIDGNGGDESDFMFRSILTMYDGKLRAPTAEFIDSYSWLPEDSKYVAYRDRIQLIGANLAQLYYLAYGDTISNVVHFRNWKWEFPDTIESPHLRTNYGKFWHVPILEVSDPSPFMWKKDSPANRVNYSLKVPKGMGTAALMQSTLRRDLATYFGYEVSIETRMMPYWKLSAPDKEFALSKLKSRDQSKKIELTEAGTPFVLQNADMRDVIAALGGFYGYGRTDFGKVPKSEQTSFIDETEITEKIDFAFDRRLSFEEIKQYLNTLGLQITREHKPFKVIVIRDPDDSPYSP